MKINDFLLLLPLSIPALTLPASSVVEKRCAKGWCPAIRDVVYTPSGYTIDTCPAVPPNPFKGHFDKGRPLQDIKDDFKKKKRTLPNPNTNTNTDTLNKRAGGDNPLCRQIASNSVEDFPNFTANTGTLTLVPGTTYVFSWSFDSNVEYIELWASPSGASLSSILHDSPHSDAQASGTWAFTMATPPGAHEGDVIVAHFELAFEEAEPDWAWRNPYQDFPAHIYGQFALFAILEDAPDMAEEVLNAMPPS
jgi:hypothetical protein